MDETARSEKQIRLILLTSSGVGLVMFLISLFYFKDPAIYSGVLSGCVLGIANLIFLTKIVVKIFSRNYKSKLGIALLFILKLLFIVIVIGLSFWVVHVNVKAFAAGYLCLIIGMTFGQLVGYKNTTAVAKNEEGEAV